MEKKKIGELHVHLEGCVWESHISRWRDNSGFLFPAPSLFYKNNFERFLAQLRFRYNFLNSPVAYGQVVQDYAIQAVSNNIVYAEMSINIVVIETWSLDLNAVLSEINEKMAEMENCPVIRFILDIPWQFTKHNYNYIFNNIENLKKAGVVGIGLGGDEKRAHIKSAMDIFNDAKKAGLYTLCHAGETTDYKFAIELVEKLEPDRIVHALSIADWIEKLGPQSPPVDVCFSSNLLLTNINQIYQHPFWRWVNAGVPVNISTDDPAIFHTTLQNELYLASKAFNNFDIYYSKIEENLLKAAFDKDSLRNAMKKSK